MNTALADFFFRPVHAANLVMMRTICALSALWIVLSRPDLPSLLAFPDVMWASVPHAHKIAYLLLFPLGVERALYAALIVLLLLVLAGVAAPVTCLLSGLLLYHFAPIETLMWTPDPMLRGLTLPTLGMVIVACAPAPGWRDRWIRDRSWVLPLFQVIVAEVYWFAGIAKVRNAGLDWLSSSSLTHLILSYDQIHGIATGSTPLGYRLAAHPSLCSFVGAGGLALELAFPLVLVSRRARVLFVPAVLAMHLGIALLMNIVFLEAGFVLVFVDWPALRRRVWGGA